MKQETEKTAVRKYTPNKRAFVLRYFGATNNRGSRIKIIDCRFGLSKYVDRSYNHTDGSIDAIQYLEARGIHIEGQAERSDNETLLFSSNFDIALK